MKKIILIGGVVIVAGAVIWFVSSRPLFENAENAYVMPNSPIACTQEAKLCPDGSYVGRTGPMCEFADCPTSPTPISTKSGISGTVTLSPTCPVEQDPPQPGCAPKGYATTINILKSGSLVVIKTVSSNANGEFSAELAPGSYTLQAQGGKVVPRCGDVSVIVKSNQYTKTEISCDSGIR